VSERGRSSSPSRPDHREGLGIANLLLANRLQRLPRRALLRRGSLTGSGRPHLRAVRVAPTDMAAYRALLGDGGR
jgi:hypothetical protein